MLDRRQFLLSTCGIFSLSRDISSASQKSPARDFVYMMNYIDLEDFELVSQWNINTVLVTLDPEGKDWNKTYDAAIKHNLQLVPLIWGHDQSIWHWNQTNREWELNDRRYPQSIGAKFLRFLKDNHHYQQQTFAIYSFHEPLAKPGYVEPKKLKKFYLQIQEEFSTRPMNVYGEDMTFVWSQADECLTDVLDYEIHTFYPFASTRSGRYRPFSPKGYYLKPTSDLKMVFDNQRETIEIQLKRFQEAKPAINGRRPQLIVILQTFVDSGEKDLWNRMPDTHEMKKVADFILSEFQDRIAGIAWYPFRQAANNYTHWLHKDRYDDQGRDRWSVVAEVGQQLRKKSRLK